MTGHSDYGDFFLGRRQFEVAYIYIYIYIEVQVEALALSNYFYH